MSVSSCTCNQEEESSFTVGNAVAPKKPFGDFIFCCKQRRYGAGTALRILLTKTWA